MLFDIFRNVFKNTFFARFVLFFGVGWAFSILVDAEQEIHGWSFWNWSLSNLEFGPAALRLSFWMIGLFIVATIIEYRDAKKRQRLSK